MKKFVLMQKQMILTSERRVEHLFAGRNTQQLYTPYKRAFQNQNKSVIKLPKCTYQLLNLEGVKIKCEVILP